MKGHKQGNRRCRGERIDKNRVIGYIGVRMLLTRLFVDNLLAVVVLGGGGREEVKKHGVFQQACQLFFLKRKSDRQFLRRVSDSKRIQVVS